MPPHVRVGRARWLIRAHCTIDTKQRAFTVAVIVKALKVTGRTFAVPDEIRKPEVGTHPVSGNLPAGRKMADGQ